MWHAKTRAGTNFADPKTRIVRYKVLTKAPCPAERFLGTPMRGPWGGDGGA